MLTIIPARGGSRRIPYKNIKDFHGKPIIAYSIELGRQTSTEVYVTTDDHEIAMVATVCGAKVLQRPPELARDEIGTQEVVGHALEEIGFDGFGEIMVLYATAPLLSKDDVVQAYFAYANGPRMSCRYSATPNGDDTGGFYIAKGEFFKRRLNPHAYGLPWPTADIDINTPEDWERAEKLYEERYGQ